MYESSKMKNVILLVSVILMFLLTACASPGPMQTSTGLMHTPAFRPIILDTIDDGSEEILFKEYTTMYDNKELRRFGIFFITDKGVYMATWDTHSYVYNIHYRLSVNNIAEILNETVVRDFWRDSNLLVIKDTRGNKIGFALHGKIGARLILQNLIDKPK